MAGYLITFRRRYWTTLYTHLVQASSFGDAQEKFEDSQEDDNSIIVKIENGQETEMINKYNESSTERWKKV